ncbi:MAG: hypothetical protein JST84_06200 [Acidobacteria bacterium]|nr:hypothetical protein [Acidobacteriota bacterium]
MKIGIAYLRGRSETGGFIDFAVFNADARSGGAGDRADVLQDLTERARAAGLTIQKSALAFNENGRITFYGTPDLVEYLSNNGVPAWTHYLTL